MTRIAEPFSQGTSLLHRADPRVKIVAGITFSFLVAMSQRLEALTAATAFSLMLLFVARLPLREVLRRLALVNGFIFFLWLVLPLTIPGWTLVNVGSLTLSREGVLLAGFITLKCNTILVAFLALFTTCSSFTLFHAMSHMHVPNKIVQLFFFCGRYIHLFQTEYQRLRTAMRIRGFQPRTNLHTYRSFAYLIGMLLVRSVDRSERIYRAMLCRGFEGAYPTLVNFSITRKDLALGAGMFAYLVFIMFIEWSP